MPNANKTLDTLSLQPSKETMADFHSTIIPKSFHLGGLKIDVRLDPNCGKENGCLGQALYATQEIIIDPELARLQTTEQAYLHELIHWIFFMMGEHELRNNERIVDCFAHFLYQALTTSEPLPTPDDDVPFDLD